MTWNAFGSRNVRNRYYETQPARGILRRDFFVFANIQKCWHYVIIPNFLLPWSFGWILGMLSLFSGRLYELNPTQSPILLTLFLIAWLICWTIGGGYILYSVTWMLFGQEVVEITENSFIVRQQVFGFSNEQIYNLSDLWNLQTIAKEPATPLKNQYKPWNGQGEQTLAFDTAWVQFALGLASAKPKLQKSSRSCRKNSHNTKLEIRYQTITGTQVEKV